jgi:hypothetical protein
MSEWTEPVLERPAVNLPKRDDRRRGMMLSTILLIAAVPLTVRAQASRPGGVQDPLAARQQIVRDRLVQLEDRMFRLTEKLSKAEPEQAGRLEKALRESGEKLIRHHMEEAVRLLDQANVTEAAEHQAAAQKALEEILQLLTESTGDSRERRQEMERIDALRKQIDAILGRQRELRARTDPQEKPATRVAAAAAKLRELIDRERKEIGKTREAAGGSDRRKSAALAESQADVRSATDALGKELAGPAPASQPPPATQPKPDPLERAADEARSDLEQASGRMRAAERDLGRGRPAEAEPNQAKALEAMERAMGKLGPAGGAKPLRPDEAAREQKGLQQDTDKIADSMDGKPGSPSGRDGGQSRPADSPGSQPSPGADRQADSGSPAAPPAPGADNMRQAGQHMKNAGDKLERNKPAAATRDQEKAIEELEKAQAELQESLDQLRREEQEEMLAGLEQRFRTMLLEQKAINSATSDLDGRRQQWARSDELNLAGLSERQSRLQGEAAKAFNILTEAGNAVVFPQIVAQVRDDMADAARRLGEKQTGRATQEIQAGIVQAIEELIAAVEQRQKDGPPPAGEGAGMAGGGQQSDSPLLPGSAELKLLRSCQVRVNTQTQQLQASTPPDHDAVERARRLSARQEQLADMARKMSDRAEGQ